MAHPNGLLHRTEARAAEVVASFGVVAWVALLCATVAAGWALNVGPLAIAVVLGGAGSGGLVVCAVNTLSARKYARMVDHITSVDAHTSLSMYASEWFGYDPSADRIGDAGGDAMAGAFDRLLDTMSKRSDIERGLRSFTGVLSQQVDLAGLSRVSLAKLLALTGAEAGVIFLDREGFLAPLMSTRVADPDRILLFSGVASALRTGKMTRYDPEESSGLMIDGVSGAPASRAREIAIAPLMFCDQSLGLVVLASLSPFKNHTISLFDLLRVSLGFALTHADAREKMQKLATYDSLTSAYNRRFGLEHLQQEYSRAARSGRPFGVLMLDLDHFKSVNDTYGHIAGDDVLRAVGRALGGAIREGDVLMRYGGEEFLVVLPDADLETVEIVGERLRAAVAAIAVPHGGESISLTVSLGAAAYEAGRTFSTEQILADADAALYVAKDAGRGRLRSFRVEFSSQGGADQCDDANSRTREATTSAP